MRSFFKELRRRNVYKVGAMYAVAGWLLVQIATQVLPIFDVSALAQRVIVLVIVAGFPVVLVLSWIYELTPQGIVKTDQVAPSESITRYTGQKLNFVIIGVLVLAVVFLGVQRYLLPQKSADVPAAAVDKSVAVLPFENLSDDKANAYFAEGIQDEILTRLAKIGALKVISRTSTQHYASSPSNLPEIARQLGVANILEGSVQRAGDAVHINVQLIRAATDDHLWAEIYNRKLDDIFGVEGEVAGAIAEALNARLTGSEQEALAKKPTDDLAAYDAYLRARAMNAQSYSYSNARKVAAAYTEAVRLDPKFALAWAELSLTTGYLYFNNVDPAQYTAQATKIAADTALQLQPQLGEAQLAQGNYRYRVLRDFAGAQRDFEAALQRSPNDRWALQLLALVERRQGKWDQALAHLEQTAQLDPRDAGLMVTIGGETLSNLRRYDEAREWLDRALALSPGDTLAIGYKIYSYQCQGRLEDAARIIDAVAPADIDPGIAYQRMYQRLLERRYTVAIAEVQAVLARGDVALEGYGPVLTLYLGIAQDAAGQSALAQATFERLIAQIEPLAARPDDTEVPMTLALAYAHAKHNNRALEQARHAVELYHDDGLQLPYSQLVLAQVQVITGDHDSAIAALGPLLTVPAGIEAALLRLDPVWDPLREDPRFQALLKPDAEGKGGVSQR